MTVANAASVAARASSKLSARELVSGALAVGARECGAYFDSSIAYVYTIAFVVLSSSVFMNEFFLAGRVEMRSFFERMPLLFAVFLPAVTMRLWAEERKQRTLELLLTLPIVPLQAILGKYLAALALLALFVVGSLPIVVMLAILGHPDYGLILSGYLGVACLGALFLALGMCLSAMSSDQIVAFVTSSVLCFALVLLGEARVVAVLDGLAPALGGGTWLHDHVSIAPHYDAFVAGSVELSALVFFGGLSALLLGLNAWVLRRWRA